MFHTSQTERAKRRIQDELKEIDVYGSVKVYLCFFDDLMVADSEYNGLYPCSEKSPDLKEMISMIRECMTGSYTISTNVPFGGVPAELDYRPSTKDYIEVCRVYKMD